MEKIIELFIFFRLTKNKNFIFNYYLKLISGFLLLIFLLKFIIFYIKFIIYNF